MADGEIKITEMGNPLFDGGSLVPVAYPDAQAVSGYGNGKYSLAQIGEGIVDDLAYPNSNLKTSVKTVTGAINQILLNFAPEFNPTLTYSEGDCRIYQGVLYQANQDIDTPEAWESTHWDQIKAVDVGAGGTPVEANPAGSATDQLKKLLVGSTIYGLVKATLSGTLTAGSTSLTLSNAAIATSDLFDIYTSVYGVNPTAVAVTTGQIVLTFEAQASNIDVVVEVH